MFCRNRSEICMERHMTTKTKKFSHKGKTLAFCVSYTTFGDQELELPDRFDLLDEAVAAAWVLLNAGSARMVDIPDPKRKGGGAAASATPRLSIEASDAVMSCSSAIGEDVGVCANRATARR